MSELESKINAFKDSVRRGEENCEIALALVEYLEANLNFKDELTEDQFQELRSVVDTTLMHIMLKLIASR